MCRGLAIVKGFVLFLILLCSFFRAPQIAGAQVVVIPEGGKPDEFTDVTLKLIGKSCDVSLVKRTLLDLEGVIDVDTETVKRHAVVYYFPKKVTEQDVVNIVGTKNQGCFTSIVPPSGGVGPVGNTGGVKENQQEPPSGN